MSATDADNNTTTYNYDADNELTKTTRADNSTLTYGYDADGNQTTQTDADGKATAYEFTDAAYPHVATAVTDPDNRTTTYGYDLGGNQVSKQAPAGNCSAAPVTSCTTYGYDPDKRLTSITYSDGTTPNVTYSYDADGHRTGMTDQTGSSAWTWDSLGRMVSSKDGAGNTVTYGYDLAGNQTSIGYPGSRTVTNGFDSAGRETSVTDWASNTTNFAYDADSNVATETLPSATGVKDTFGYDNTDAMSSIIDTNGSGTFASFAYTRDANGQLLGTTATGTGQSNQAYGYNSLNQLGQANGSPYTYDSANNPTKLASGATQSFDPANQLCWQSPSGVSGTCSAPPSGATTYTYNNRGDRTGATAVASTVTMAYDQADRLASYSATPVTGNATTATYAYNGDGLRASKTVNSGTAETFVWDQSGSLPLVLVDGSTSFVYGTGGLPLEQLSSTGTVTWLHHDQVGSTVALTDASGNVVGTYTHDPYGSVTGNAGTATSPLQFTGGYTDQESGFSYLVPRQATFARIEMSRSSSSSV